MVSFTINHEQWDLNQSCAEWWESTVEVFFVIYNDMENENIYHVDVGWMGREFSTNACNLYVPEANNFIFYHLNRVDCLKNRK